MHLESSTRFDRFRIRTNRVTGGGANMGEDTLGPVRRGLAVMCHHCPLCRYGRENPESILGRMLRHKLHADYCPMWKAERERYGTDQRKAGDLAEG
jgi:hypothetical protein